ncbi:MAG: hypothetical protein ACOCTT_03555, partial [archaeon]
MEKKDFEFEIEKKGVKLKFKNPELDKYRRITFDGKINEGDWFNTKRYDEEKGIIWFWTEKKIKGYNVDAVIIEDKELKQKIGELKEEMINERKEKIEDFRQRLEDGEKLIKVIETGHRFKSLSCYPADEIEESIGTEDAIKLINNIANTEIYGESPETDSEGMYSIFEVAGERKEKAEKEEERKQELIEKAKETGEKQVYREYTMPCQDESEDCSFDNVTEYI